MPKFSFMSWNVRHFRGTRARLNEVDALITRYSPDVFGLIEYQGKSSIRELMVDRFPEYDFCVTDSTGNLEMVVGVRRGKFDQVVWTQKREFNNAPRTLRPGALISLRVGREFYNLLFLHTDSGTTASDYNNRTTVFRKVWKLRRALARRATSGRANLIVLGDLNTMGRGRSITGAREIATLERNAEANGMLMVTKDRDDTWSQWGRGPRGNRRALRIGELNNLMTSNLDHVIADDHLDFVAHGDNNEAIHVEGWHQRRGRARSSFLFNLSDHCALFGEVW